MNTIVVVFIIAAILALVASLFCGHLLARYGFPVPDNQPRIGHIDGLRGYLALLVAISHFVMWTRLVGWGIPWGKTPATLNTIGQGPVAIFFMITGLLFYPKVRGGFGKVSWPSLIISRLFRIYPAALLAIALIVVSLWRNAGYPVDSSTLIDTARNLVFWTLFISEPPLFGITDSELANAGVFWTLRAEWIFYLGVLPLFSILRSLAPSNLSQSFSPILMIPLYGLFKVLAPGFAGFITHFMLGMIAFEICENPRLASFFRKDIVATFGLLIMIAAAILLPTPTTGRTVIFYFPFFICVACGHSYFGALSSKGALVLGEASYGIYVLHGFVLWVIANGAKPLIVANPVLWAAALPPVLALIALLSAAIYLGIEAPMIRKGRQIGRQMRR